MRLVRATSWGQEKQNTALSQKAPSRDHAKRCDVIRPWHALTILILISLTPALAADLRLVLAVEPNSIDPHVHNFGGNKSFMKNLFETLTVIGANGRPEPNLATSWTLIDDTTWDITLRPDVTFSDGTKFTADDVAFTLRRALEVPSTVTTFAEYVKSIARAEVIGPHRLRLHTNGPFPLLPEYMASIGIVSRAHGETTTSDYNNGKGAIGTGPFRLVSWARADRLVMQRNERYWGAKPAWNTATFRYVKNASSRLATLLAGDADLIDTVSVQDLERLRNDKRFVVISGLSADIVGFVFDKREQPSPKITGNDGQPLAANPFHDKRVRAAVDLAIDRDAIRDRVMNGQSAPDNQFMSPGQYGHDPSLPPTRHDPLEAKRLLAEAGYPNGFRLTMHCQNDRFVNDAAICQAIAQMLTRAGIATTPEVMPHAVWVPRANKKEFSFFTTFWTFDTPEPSIVLISQFATADAARGRGAFNRGVYSNPEFDSVLEKALTMTDRDKREKLLIQATGIAIRDHATVPLHHQFNIEAMTTRVRHTPRADGHIMAADITPADQ
ncbi:MAG: ABC transporter substrate-binding protein [Acetobacteraceae bacterium]|nr:ABC transporter substrate-binding protein [Acetobacteraceae bacterium]